jgi:hypothetical protein
MNGKEKQNSKFHNNQNIDNRTSYVKKCFLCGKEGHLKANCYLKNKPDLKCYKCGESGHISTRC